jgi:hypothetical protein
VVIWYIFPNFGMLYHGKSGNLVYVPDKNREKKSKPTNKKIFCLLLGRTPDRDPPVVNTTNKAACAPNAGKVNKSVCRAHGRQLPTCLIRPAGLFGMESQRHVGSVRGPNLQKNSVPELAKPDLSELVCARCKTCFNNWATQLRSGCAQTQIFASAKFF